MRTNEIPTSAKAEPVETPTTSAWRNVRKSLSPMATSMDAVLMPQPRDRRGTRLGDKCRAKGDHRLPTAGRRTCRPATELPRLRKQGVPGLEPLLNLGAT